MPKPIKPSIRLTATKAGTKIYARGAAAKALFNELTTDIKKLSPKKCEACKGTGIFIEDDGECPSCDGTGTKP